MFRIVHAFSLRAITSLSPGQPFSHIWRHTTCTMKGRTFSSGTEKCVFPASFLDVFVFICLNRLPFLAAGLDLTAKSCLMYPTCYPPSSSRMLTPAVGSYVQLCAQCSSCVVTGRGGADLRGLVEHLLGPTATDQAADAGWPRAYPAATLLYVLALRLQSGQSRVSCAEGYNIISIPGNGKTEGQWGQV